MKEGQHLFTKDGRVFGNAIITQVTSKGLIRIETDFGNGGSFLTKEEVETHWHLHREGHVTITPVAEWRADRAKAQTSSKRPLIWAALSDVNSCPVWVEQEKPSGLEDRGVHWAPFVLAERVQLHAYLVDETEVIAAVSEIQASFLHEKATGSRPRSIRKESLDATIHDEESGKTITLREALESTEAPGWMGSTEV